MMSADNRNTRHYLLIDESKAYQGALELLDQAEVLATSGNYIEALETLSSALEIYPDNLEIEALSPDYYQSASLQLLDAAKDYYEQGDIQNMLQTIYEYQDLRGRQHATPEWSAFSKQLHSTAEQANITLDWESSYYLYLAATLADPDASWSAKKLEIARRDYLLNRSETINTNLAGGILDD
jgi:tetratricopeptide (TPR) repeat protein